MLLCFNHLRLRYVFAVGVEEILLALTEINLRIIMRIEEGIMARWETNLASLRLEVYLEGSYDSPERNVQYLKGVCKGGECAYVLNPLIEMCMD